MNWNLIWSKNNFLQLDDYPTNNIFYFYQHHLVNLKKKSKILDNGCGSGRNFKFLTNLGFDVYGTDISKFIINKNKKKFKKYKTKFFLGDIRELNFEDNYFDVIISEASLYYQDISQIRETVNKFYRLLKKDGLIRVYTKSINDNFFMNFDKRSSKEIIIKKNHWEKNLKLSFLSLNDIKSIFKNFKKLKIGIDEFNYINHKKKHSFYIITATK